SSAFPPPPHPDWRGSPCEPTPRWSPDFFAGIAYAENIVYVSNPLLSFRIPKTRSKTSAKTPRDSQKLSKIMCTQILTSGFGCTKGGRRVRQAEKKSTLRRAPSLPPKFLIKEIDRWLSRHANSRNLLVQNCWEMTASLYRAWPPRKTRGLKISFIWTLAAMRGARRSRRRSAYWRRSDCRSRVKQP